MHGDGTPFDHTEYTGVPTKEYDHSPNFAGNTRRERPFFPRIQHNLPAATDSMGLICLY